MKTLSRLLFLLILAGFMHSAEAQSPPAKIELYSISGSSTEMRIGARMTPQVATMYIEAVSVAVAYDINVVSLNPNTAIQNRHFAQYGYIDASSADWQLTPNPGICVYGEYHPNFGGEAISKFSPPTLCEFLFAPKTSGPGTADFTVYANNATGALTYYFEPWFSGQQNYSPVVNLSGMEFPVELSSFTAAQQGQSIALRWVTQTETGNHGFHVQRRDLADATGDWATISFVDGAGDTKMERQYLLFDWNLPHDGEYAYRLKQEDFNGSETISDAVVVHYVNAPLQFALRQNYPNPVSLSNGESATLGYDIAERSRVRLTVSNMLGQQVAVVAEHTLDAGSYNANWQPTDITAGTYVVTLSAETVETGRTEIHHQRMQVVR